MYSQFGGYQIQLNRKNIFSNYISIIVSVHIFHRVH